MVNLDYLLRNEGLCQKCFQLHDKHSNDDMIEKCMCFLCAPHLLIKAIIIAQFQYTKTHFHN